MNEFCQYLFDRRDDALDAAGEARGRLVHLLDECQDDIAEAVAELARLQPYARWWMKVTDNIEHGGMDPVAALTAVRTAAREALLLVPNRHTACPFTNGESAAATEATRRFYTDTTTINLEAITRREAAPTITPRAAGPLPVAGPLPSPARPQPSGPTARPAWPPRS